LTILFLLLFFLSSASISAEPFVIHIARETISLGDETREDEPGRPPYWTDPEDNKFEVIFSIPFSAQQAELHMEVLNVNSLKNYVKVHDVIVGALYPDAGDSFYPSMIIIPVSFLNMGENTLIIESNPGIEEEDYDDFLIRNVRLVLYRPGDHAVTNTSPPSNTNEVYGVEQKVTFPSRLDIIEGDEFVLNLVSSPAEGYRWQIMDNSYNPELLRLVSQNERIYDIQGRLEQQFKFLALLPGSTQVEFRKFYSATGELAVLDSQVSSIDISKLIILKGIVRKLDYPVGQFGTHQLVDETGNVICILRTTNGEINFDEYTGLTVKVAGKTENSDLYDQSMGLIFTVRNISVVSQ